jgi:hypothetical protein
LSLVLKISADFNLASRLHCLLIMHIKKMFLKLKRPFLDHFTASRRNLNRRYRHRRSIMNYPAQSVFPLDRWLQSTQLPYACSVLPNTSYRNTFTIYMYDQIFSVDKFLVVKCIFFSQLLSKRVSQIEFAGSFKYTGSKCVWHVEFVKLEKRGSTIMCA